MRHLGLPPAASRVATRQHGVVSGRQLLDSGLTRRQIRTRIEGGVLVPVFGDTYRILGSPRSVESKMAAAALAVPDAAISHAAAGWVLDLPPGVSSTAPELSAPNGARHDVEGVTVHRCRDLIRRHQTIVRGLPVTTLPRTVIDLAGQLPVTTLGELIDELSRQRRLPITRLHDEHDRIARKGRAGTTAMRLVLTPRLAGRFIEPSELERRGLDALRRHGLPEPEREFRPPWTGPAVTRVDLAYPELRLIIELDGRRWHDRSDAFENDRLRDQLAAAAGWLVIRVTWRQLRDDELATMARLASAMVHRAA